MKPNLKVGCAEWDQQQIKTLRLANAIINQPVINFLEHLQTENCSIHDEVVDTLKDAIIILSNDADYFADHEDEARAIARYLAKLLDFIKPMKIEYYRLGDGELYIRDGNQLVCVNDESTVIPFIELEHARWLETDYYGVLSSNDLELAKGSTPC